MNPTPKTLTIPSPDGDAVIFDPDGPVGQTATLTRPSSISEKDIQNLPSALDRRSEIGRRAGKRRIAVFLDYDGTLTPIVASPEAANLSAPMRRTLETLSKHAPVAVISGRDLDDVRKRVDIPTIYYAGSHGFDILGPDLRYRHGREFLPALEGAEAHLTERLKNIGGVRIERKTFSIAVHYRQVREPDIGRVEAVVDAVLAMHETLRKSGGKKIFELQPGIEWHKGKAVLWLMENLGLGGPEALPFFIGDDLTDEDAFKTLAKHGIGIVVRDNETRTTAAAYALENTDGTMRFLEFLISIRSGDSQRA